MAKQVKLKAELRTSVGRSAVRKLKARGIIPAVIYGGKDKAQPLQVAARDINTMMSHASGENVLVELEIAGEKSSRTALVQEVQHSPVGGDIRHVDFHAISMDETIQAEVPLEPIGTANGVKNFGGLLEQSLRALTIEGKTLHHVGIPIHWGFMGLAKPGFRRSPGQLAEMRFPPRSCKR